MVGKAILAGLGLAAATLMAVPVQAAPVGALPFAADSGVLLVSGGCGPGGFRAANGACYPRRPPPPRFRRCPYGYHPTPYGCRPNY